MILGQAVPDDASRSIARLKLNVDAEQNHIIILHHVILPLTAHFAALFGYGERATFEKGCIIDDFGTNESALEVTVDFAGGLGCFCAFDDGPGASFLFAGGEITYKSQKFVGRFDKAIETALFKTVIFHEHGAIFIGELGQIFFELGTKHDSLGVFVLGDFST